MLRNCEVDIRREPSRSQVKPGTEQSNTSIAYRNESSETCPVPSSPVKIAHPKCSGVRFSPRKTHLTNFINQNITPADILRRQHSDELATIISVSHPSEPYETKMKRSPCLQFNTLSDSRKKLLPPKSPLPRRRFRSQSPHNRIEESDSDNDLKADLPFKKLDSIAYNGRGINGINDCKVNQPWHDNRLHTDDIVNQNTIAIPSIRIVSSNGSDDRPFRSIDVTHRSAEDYYCPQSEPVKRKIYSESEKILDSLQRSFDMESGRILIQLHLYTIAIYFYQTIRITVW